MSNTSQQALGSAVVYATTPPAVTIGGASVTMVGAALNPGALGLYQIAVTIPAGAASGDQSIAAIDADRTSPSGLFIAAQ